MRKIKNVLAAARSRCEDFPFALLTSDNEVRAPATKSRALVILEGTRLVEFREFRGRRLAGVSIGDFVDNDYVSDLGSYVAEAPK